MLTGAAGCVEFAGSEEEGATNGSGDETATSDAGGTGPADAPDIGGDGDPSYFLTAAPVEANDGLEPVLSTDEGAVAAIEPLMAVIREVTEIFEVTHEPVTPAEAEAFEELTADVERYFTGNPPGYYFGHERRRVSVTLGGG